MTSKAFNNKRPRKYSLERDVYYFENSRREEIVNYEAGGPTIPNNGTKGKSYESFVRKRSLVKYSPKVK